MKYIGVGIFLIIITQLLAVSCTSQRLALQLQRLDTLQNMMADLDGALLIDENALSLRIDSIDSRVEKVLQLFPDSGNTEIRYAIVRYMGIKGNYEEVLKKYPIVTFDVDQQKDRLAAFKNDVIHEHLDNEHFLARYERQKQHILQMQSIVERLNYNTSAVESDYRHSSKILKNAMK